MRSFWGLAMVVAVACLFAPLGSARVLATGPYTDLVVEATSASGAVVNYVGDPSCTPPPGQFPLGVTPVTCVDGTFSVTVQDTTPPTLNLPGTITQEATSASGNAVSFSVTATDLVDPSPTVVCDHTSGATYAIGTTTVSCTATDATGNHSSGSFDIVVQDTTPPTISNVPSTITQEATSPSGNAVTYTAPTATDTVDPSPSVNCSPASGSTFPIGTTTVTCTATDATGNSSSASFDVVIQDTTAPVVTVPASFSATSSSPGGTAVTFSASANDNIDGPIPVNCVPTSGSVFAIGPTTVDCSATDAHGNTGSASFVVTVSLVDTTPPVVTVPASFSVEATGPGGASVTYSASANDNIDGPIAPTCSPASGSLFPLGTTTVNCSATDAHGNTGNASFQVTVQDTQGPVFSGVANIQRQANGPGGSIVNYTPPTAVDAVDGPVPVVCTPPSGVNFPIATTTVHCTAQDHLGHVTTASFTVTVADTLPPHLIVPGDFQVYADTPTGANRSSAGVQLFLSLASATDLVDPHPRLTNDAPPVLPLGDTYVTFTATDSSGNVARANSKLTVLPMPAPGTTPPPLPVPDRIPPDDVGSLKAHPGDGVADLTWTKPKAKDFDHVVVTRESEGGAPQVVYTGSATSFHDTGLENGIEYRYTIVAYDHSGNASGGVVAVVVPRALALLSPKGGAKVKKTAKLRWRSVADARYYNVQIFFGGQRALASGTAVKVLSVWPVGTSYVLKKTWKYLGKRRTLKPGLYTWFVWPGFGERSAANYGQLLGSSTFQVVKK
jgi:HYR domain-containing protein